MRTVVRVARDLTGSSASDLARNLAKRIPNGRTTSILGHSALNLIGRGRKAPNEISRQRRLLYRSHDGDSQCRTWWNNRIE